MIDSVSKIRESPPPTGDSAGVAIPVVTLLTIICQNIALRPLPGRRPPSHRCLPKPPRWCASAPRSTNGATTGWKSGPTCSADARIIGWGGLYDDPFDPASWGQGYATELATACTSLADNVLQLSEVRAFAHPENVASRRVLEKAGFEVMRFVPDMARFLYRRGRQGERLAA